MRKLSGTMWEVLACAIEVFKAAHLAVMVLGCIIGRDGD
jgi:hypothetical protein